MIQHWGDREFMLKDFHPQDDECKYLLLKVIEQAIRDYINLDGSITPVEKQHHETARDFLFDQDYLIEYGDKDVTLNDILDILHIEQEWFREKVTELKLNRTCEIELKSLARNKAKGR